MSSGAVSPAKYNLKSQMPGIGCPPARAGDASPHSKGPMDAWSHRSPRIRKRAPLLYKPRDPVVYDRPNYPINQFDLSSSSL